MAIADFIPSRTALGEVYMAQLPLSDLIVDQRYQRLVNPNRIKAMIADFRPGAVGALDVSQRASHTYAVIDGQHRLEVLREVCPRELVNCVVHTHLTAVDEAELFHISNARRDKPRPLDRFRARLFYQEPLAVEIARIVTAAGLRIDLSKSHSGSGEDIDAVGALEKIYTGGGETVLMQCLTVLPRIWPDEPYALSGDVLHGMATVLITFGDSVNLDRLTTTLSGLPIRKLTMEAAGHQALIGGAIATNIARAIVKHYNHALRNRLPEGELGKSSPAHPKLTNS